MVSREVHERWSRMLQDPDSRVQMEALTEIGRSYFRPEEGLEKREIGKAVHVKGPTKPELPSSLRDSILDKLKADDSNIRAEAVLALVHWRDEGTIEAILQLLKDQNSTVRLAAVQALATMDKSQFIQPLLEVAQNDPEELIRAHALSAVEGMLKVEVRVRGAVRGAVKTGGRAKPLVGILDQIADTDPSPYVAFLAQKVRKRFG